MSATVYKEDPDGTLHPIGRSDKTGAYAILDVLLRELVTMPAQRTTFVAYDDADGRELEVRG
jgi:hypothetical protein